MKVQEVLNWMGVDSNLYNPDFMNSEIVGITLDSKKVQEGFLFLGIPGKEFDGGKFCDDALQRGALYCLIESQRSDASGKIIVVPGLTQKISEIAEYFYGNPWKSLVSVGITGTNGKTTLCYLIRKLFQLSHQKFISFGTINNQIGSEIEDSQLTTPDIFSFLNNIQKGLKLGCSHLVMEVSSHSLHQGRIGKYLFDRVVFTNLTQDHLDYHKNMDEYFSAKKLLISQHRKEAGIAIVNIGDSYGKILFDSLPASRIGYTTQYYSDLPDTYQILDHVLCLESMRLTTQGSEMKVRWNGKSYSIKSGLIGKINIENALAFIATGLSLNYSMDVLEEVLLNTRVPGRTENIALPFDGLAVVDYAHTPDALERVLQTYAEIKEGNLYLVFGCGGDRDKTKRPLMGKIAEKYSDRFIITNDNPRTENPADIIQDILSGLNSPQKNLVLPDRKNAIGMALSWMKSKDILIVAGKGHEDYQILGKIKHHFSDRETIQDWVRERKILA